MPDSTIYNERELLLKIAEGDEKAFSDLFSIYIPFLLPTVKKLVKNSQIADDILQDVFIRIWLYRDKLPLVESPRSWVLKIAYNQVFTYKADLEKQARRLQRMASKQADYSHETEKFLEYNALERLLTTAINQLSPQQKKIYQLARVNGMSLQEVAEVCGISLQTVKNTLGKALQSIRNFIESSGYPIFYLLLFFQ